MLKGINKLLTGDLLKILSDMGHGDELVIADANFPADSCAKRLVRIPGVDGVKITEAILSVLPLDTYSDDPALIMDLTDSDKAKNMPEPVIWAEYEKMCGKLKKLERYEFYEKAKKAYAVIQTGEERQYGNLILVKGVII
ncbi:MAG: fucose isomerase [Erysipelotrichaceae bacterium]|nr:fucose isomerase [Erysipelotrichaceae bacterium]